MTLTFVSLIFLVLYFPHAIVHTVTYLVILSYQSHCNINLILKFNILKRLSELLNIGALGMNFFFYILCIKHYRSSAIKMLHLHHFNIFKKYLIIQHNIIKTKNRKENFQDYAKTNNLNIKLLKVTPSNEAYSTISIFNNH